MKRMTCLIFSMGALLLTASGALGATKPVLMGFGDITGVEAGRCSLNFTVDHMFYVTGTDDSTSRVIDSMFQCQTPIQTLASSPLPEHALVVTTALPFLNQLPCWNSTTFVGSTNWRILLTPSGRVTYTCTF